MVASGCVSGLSQLMHQDVNFLLLDEPTNHLDIESREVLEEALEDFAGTIVAVSHDRYFLNKLFSRTAWLEDGIITTFEGPYSWAREKWQEIQNRIEVSKPAAAKKPVLKKEKAVSINVEAEIAKLEITITELEKDAESEGDWKKYESLAVKITALKDQLESYYDMWMKEAE